MSKAKPLTTKATAAAVTAHPSGLLAGFSAKSLRHMMRFSEVFPDLEIVSTLSRQLAWSHFLELIYLRWLARHDQEPGDLPPLGIILCTGTRYERRARKMKEAT